MNDSERRKVLGEFLRNRRANLCPGNAGLPPTKPRRKPGLRREEVAQIANVGVSWYTWLEQGRDIHPSVQVLESLSRALRLTPDERRHLYLLSGQSLPPQVNQIEEKTGSLLQQAVNELGSAPAIVIGRRWDYLVWNKAANDIFAISQPDRINPSYELNLLWQFFANPVLKGRFRAWEQVASGVVAEFRTAKARYLEDSSFDGLIEDLKAVNADFGRLWLQHHVRSVLDGYIALEHPGLGILEFEHITLQVPSDPDIRMMMFLPLQETRNNLVHYFERNL
ncbi:helix-turn-helix transcriptional regulator [Paenibacillus sp. XY044]|uniref:helix-turn-helix transcriptional regulator n=1 Tax=Paenibacillus sp. XY044 TaxID=2026089 RepID=UPI000B97DE77|nr:helix-turn-helix transcriptional regulator [Paenibacillus sp. XY044]OZB93683.1 transcriptional regulator [Paenibacillus sp. XY044]